jgi:hypothetical protein
MLCTLVIAIGTFPYGLRVVTTPWSLDQDKYHETCDSREVVTCKVPPDDFVVDSVYQDIEGQDCGFTKHEDNKWTEMLSENFVRTQKKERSQVKRYYDTSVCPPRGD